MKKLSNRLLVLIALVGSVLSACQSHPSLTADSIVGIWKGQSEWLCGNDDLAWSTTIVFKADGTFTAAMTLPKSNAPFPQSVGDGTWSLSESNIEMKFSTTIWTGKVFDTKMGGSLADNGISCNGNWYLSKQ